MLFPRSCILLLSVMTLVNGQYDDIDVDMTNGFRQDVFFPAPAADSSKQQPSHLRRNLQQWQLEQSCAALEPSSTRGDCDGTYSCTCSNGEVQCPYCTVNGPWGDTCLMSGSRSIGYSRRTGTVQSCTCQYFGDGRLETQCQPWTEAPAPAPVPNPVSAPVGVPTQIRVPAPVPTPMPVPAPTPMPVPSPVAVPTAAPVDRDTPGGGNPVPTTPTGTQAPLVPLGCTATVSFANPRICLGNPSRCRPQWISCPVLGQYGCTCTDPSADDITLCSYCQVQSQTEIFCMVTGSFSTFTAPDGSEQTCGCQYAGNGQSILSCDP